MTLNPKLRRASGLLENYRQVRAQSLEICRPLKIEDYVVQPVIDVSPPKWHLGHVTWFFENFILTDYLSGYRPFDPRLNYLFNSYYESQGPRILRSNRGNMSRPTLERVLEYRREVDAQMSRLFESFEDNIIPQDLYDLVTVGLQHEQQHQELLVTDLKYILGNNPLFPVYAENNGTATPGEKNSSPPTSHFISIDEGIYEIGYKGEDFCWDNELNVHKVYLHEYELCDRLVTNGEYLEFIGAGGYEQYEHWLSEGWEWVKQLEEKAPLYWYKKGDEWFQYTLQGLQKADPDSPVTHVSYYEADAYARWRGLRLPTEQEWEVAYRQLNSGDTEEGNFLENGAFHPVPRQSVEDYQLLGNVWEWTGSAYLPYPGYPRFKGALGEYNGKFMINQMVLRGGSCATPRSHIRPTYRNFFHADKRWQFTGIRLAR